MDTSKGITLPKGSIPETVNSMIQSVRTDCIHQAGIKAIDKRYIIIEALRASLDNDRMRRKIIDEVVNRYYGR